LHQQINLFQPIFRKEKKLFSFAASIKILSVFIVGLILVFTTAQIKLISIEKELSKMKKQNAIQLALLASVSKKLDLKLGRTGGDNRVERLRKELDAGRYLLDMFGKVYTTHRVGFSGYLEGFSRSSIQGMWISTFEMKNGGKSVKISGGTMSPDLIPKFIQGLGVESILMGTQFQLLDMKRKTKEGNWVEFLLSSGDFGDDVFEVFN